MPTMPVMGLAMFGSPLSSFLYESGPWISRVEKAVADVPLTFLRSSYRDGGYSEEPAEEMSLSAFRSRGVGEPGIRGRRSRGKTSVPEKTVTRAAGM